MTAGAARSATARTGATLRRVGLGLTGVWALALGLTMTARWDPIRGFGPYEEIAYTLSATATRTWGYLGAALIIYLSGVHRGLRASQPVQVNYRPGPTSARTRRQLVPIVVIAAAITALAVGVIQQANRNDIFRDAIANQSAAPVPGQPPTSEKSDRIRCAPFEPSAPPSMQPEIDVDASTGILVVRDPIFGTGHTVSPGDTITVHYTAYLCSTGKKVDGVTTQTAEFRLNEEVIPGWTTGIAGMKVGGLRQLVVPPNLAYGAVGKPPSIPPNETMVFVIEMLDARSPQATTVTAQPG